MSSRAGRGQPSLPGLGGGGGRPPRTERVAKQLREEISQLMVREMKDPRVRLASVSEVRISPDLRSAKVMISALGTDTERDAVLRGLRHAEGYLRSQLGDRLENLKTVPSLRFEIDRSIEYSVRINALLREVAPQGALEPAEEVE
ncbi:MAG: ribosome-binding factor A [Candidatus Dormibacteria bacterium]